MTALQLSCVRMGLDLPWNNIQTAQFFSTVDQQTDYTSLFLRPPQPPRRRMGGFGSSSINSPPPCTSGWG